MDEHTPCVQCGGQIGRYEAVVTVAPARAAGSPAEGDRAGAIASRYHLHCWQDGTVRSELPAAA